MSACSLKKITNTDAIMVVQPQNSCDIFVFCDNHLKFNYFKVLSPLHSISKADKF